MRYTHYLTILKTLRASLAAPYRNGGFAAVCLVITVAWGASTTFAQEKSDAPGSSDIALRQGRLADKYARLEQLMLKMAEVDAGANPQRAALLKQAVQQSKDKLTLTRLESVVSLLDQQKLRLAVDGQSEIAADLKSLLQLLQSEDRADRNRDRQKLLKEYIQDVERLLRLQKDVQGRTAGGEKTEALAGDQAKVAERTAEVAKKIQENEQPSDLKREGDDETPPDGDEESDAQSKPKSSENALPASEKPPTPGQPADQKPNGQEGSQQPIEPQPGAPRPDKAAPSQSTPEEMPPANQQSQAQPQNPAQQRLQQAQEKMRAAQQKLEESKREDAQIAQDQARQDLERAKAELEEILRQLREEEIGRTLVQLEGRFRKMLEMQLKVNESTERLASIPADARSREVDIESVKLAVEERKIALEAEKAYQLLLEEGSSIAFPESVQEIRADMEQVAERLSRTQVDQLTLGTQEDIITALEEMLAALQQAQQDQEEKKDNPPPPPSGEGQPEDQPLVDQIAELRMLKAMQLRVNQRTTRFAKLLTEPDDPTGQATDNDLAEAVQKLSERQERLHRIARDIVLGKNQ